MASISLFPSQKKTLRQKGDKWAKECVEAGVEQVNYTDNQGLRATFYEKQVNYNLANNILDPQDVERIVNPWKIKGADFPVEMRNYALSKPKMDLLVGEELKRRFDYRVVVKNDDAITDKERLIKDKYLRFMSDKIMADSFDEQNAQEELKKLNDWRLYEAQDLRERMSTQILSVLWKTEALQHKFKRGFEDALISGEEIYSVQIISGEPTVTKENPLNLISIRSGDSIFIEDSDIIIKDGFHGIGQVIDDYYEFLTGDDITSIEDGNKINKAASIVNYPTNRNIKIPENYMYEAFGDTIVVPSMGLLNAFGGAYDTKGNIRVTQVVWRSRRKVGKLTYYDEDGDQQVEWVDENHPIDKEAGEEVKWEWVNEWWEGTRIGQDIFVKMQPLPRLGTNISNPSKSLCPFVGSLYNINSSVAMSMMSYLKPYQYLYNALMYNTELAITKNKGKIGFLPLHLIPDTWDMDTWMYYFNTMGVAVVDGFKESSKGTMAGTVNQVPTSMDLELGNYIQSNIGMLQVIKQHVDEISGVSPQRQGQIEQRELVGNTERAVTQSSHITEKWFFIHDLTKVRVLEALLETAKYAWRHSKEKRQYILDDMTTVVLDLDGESFASAEYGVVVSNASSDTELMTALKTLAQAGLQNDKLNFSDIMTIYMSDSVSSVRRKIQGAEEERMQQAQQQAQVEQQQAQAELEQKAEGEQAERDLKWNIAVLNKTGEETEPDETPPEDAAIKERETVVKETKLVDDRIAKKEALDETIRSNKARESIQRKAANKPAASKK